MTERNLRKINDEEWKQIPFADGRYEVAITEGLKVTATIKKKEEY